MLRLLYVFIFLLVSNLLFSQRVADSLIIVFNKQKNIAEKAITANRLAKEFRFINPDTSVIYSTLAVDLSNKSGNSKEEGLAWFNMGRAFKTKYEFDTAFSCFEKSLKLRRSLKDTLEESRVLNELAIICFEKGNFRKSVELYENSIRLKELLKDKKGIGVNWYNIGNTYMRWGKYKEAMDYYKKAREMFTSIPYDEGLASVLNSLGILYEDWENLTEALKYYHEALHIENKMGNAPGIINLCNNIGNVLKNRQEYDSTAFYFSKAYDLSKKTNDRKNEAIALRNLGLLYCDMGEYDKSNSELQKALSIAGNMDVIELKVQILHAMGYSLTYQNRCREALEYLLKSLELAEGMQYREMITNNYIFISQAYLCAGDGKQANKYYWKFMQDREKLNKELNDLSIKYETERQEKEIELLNKQGELNHALLVSQKEKMKNQRLLLYAFISGFLLILFFSILVYRQYRQKKKANIMLAEQNVRIKSQNEEISTQRDEIQKQHNHIVEIHKEITDSIEYAKRIQRTMLPKESFMDEILGEHFILFKPKDIVSGDFFWTAKVDGKCVIAVADCTGHGVPGAFMSMLGVSFLSDIVIKEKVLDSNVILDLLRKRIIESLQQKGQVGEQKDGMDMALCVLDKNNNALQFSGANNPIYIIAKAPQGESLPPALNEIRTDVSATCQPARLETNAPIQKPALMEVKGDKMPIAIYEKMNPFSCNSVKVNPGDILYLFSDGFADQIGGPRCKKFKYQPFKDLLLQIYIHPLSVQCEILDKTITEWVQFSAGNHLHLGQMDDITVVGLRIT